MSVRTLRNLIAATAGAVGAIEAGAFINVALERRRRAYLRDLLYTEIRGDGRPVVFLAGFQGSTRYWNGYFDDLTVERRLVLVDALGFGRSQWPLHPPTLGDHLNALRRTLVAFEATSRVTFVAHSFGAILAAYYASLHVEEITRLILLGAPIFTSEGEARERIAAMSPMAALFALRPLLARESCQIVCALRQLFQAVAPLILKVPREVAEDSILHSWPALKGAMNNILLSRPIEEPLHVVASKTTFIHSAGDAVTPLSRVREVATRTGAELITIEGNHQSYVTTGQDVIRGVIRRSR